MLKNRKTLLYTRQHCKLYFTKCNDIPNSSSHQEPIKNCRAPAVTNDTCNVSCFPYFIFLSHLRFPENYFRKKQKTHCPDKLKRFYQLFSLNFASIKSCEKSWAIFGEYLISGFLGIYNAFLLNFGGFLDFARIKFRDSFQIAKLAKFSTREIKWE